MAFSRIAPRGFLAPLVDSTQLMAWFSDPSLTPLTPLTCKQRLSSGPICPSVQVSSFYFPFFPSLSLSLSLSLQKFSTNPICRTLFWHCILSGIILLMPLTYRRRSERHSSGPTCPSVPASSLFFSLSLRVSCRTNSCWRFLLICVSHHLATTC